LELTTAVGQLVEAKSCAARLTGTGVRAGLE
jgi:hypothetical protein